MKRRKNHLIARFYKRKGLYLKKIAKNLEKRNNILMGEGVKGKEKGRNPKWVEGKEEKRNSIKSTNSILHEGKEDKLKNKNM